MTTVPSPPPVPHLEPSSAAEPARQRLIPKSRFPFSISLPNLRAPPLSKLKWKGKQKETDVEQDLSAAAAADDENAEDPSTIKLSAPRLTDDDEYQDKYEWAVLYENQRGLTLFSIPYYSSNSLLPSDPAPFTMPSAVSLKRAHQPSVSLKEYPLPDGNWCWVSNSWMVDMRSDSGEVQHDGFEYNWIFRTHHWHPQVGLLSAAGWVRRRRWVRLMMRPGKKRRMVTEEGDGMNDGPTPTITSLSLRSSWNGWDKRLSTTPSLFTNTTSQRDTFYLPEVWQGNVDEDWFMCRELMKMATSDGAKLELWKRWLGLAESTDPSETITKGKQKAEGLDDDQSFEWPSVPPLEYVIAVIRSKLTTILKNFFVFPESRRVFIELLFKAEIFDRVSGLEHSMTLVKALDFWSLNSELGDLKSISSNHIRSSKSMDV
ncbi:hypothetical protein LENED_005379 [Lentinula edodes]|uniref:TECPR1-like DysF domain-containing protein n=1 Tax=Lentinula edodes TaxID=5353 RepID=A0A1Q3E8T3_LENED|nr:hypothetical protein F5877DRAFT_67572 [Lentinula edodes]GAW03640.1 hypothetical protein LENED_005379 [Lentinula edodes]